MAFDDDMNLDETLDTPTTDEDLEREDLEGEEDELALSDDELLKDDAEAVREGELSEPDHFIGKNEDSGSFDDANWEGNEIRRGAGDNEDEDDLEDLGFHEERFTTAIDDGTGDNDL